MGTTGSTRDVDPSAPSARGRSVPAADEPPSGFLDLARQRWICGRCRRPMTFAAAEEHYLASSCVAVRTDTRAEDGWERIDAAQYERLVQWWPREHVATRGLVSSDGPEPHAAFLLRSPHWPVLSVDQCEACIDLFAARDQMSPAAASERLWALGRTEVAVLAAAVGLECVARTPSTAPIHERRSRRATSDPQTY